MAVINNSQFYQKVLLKLQLELTAWFEIIAKFANI